MPTTRAKRVTATHHPTTVTQDIEGGPWEFVCDQEGCIIEPRFCRNDDRGVVIAAAHRHSIDRVGGKDGFVSATVWVGLPAKLRRKGKELGVKLKPWDR